MTFTRHNKNIISQYYINNMVNLIYLVATVKYLAYYFFIDLTFTEHINITCNKKLCVFGFLKRNCWEFIQRPYVLKSSLFFTNNAYSEI